MWEFETVVEAIGKAVDLVGVAVIVLGIMLATARNAVGQPWSAATFRSYRRDVGRAILLGLEFLVAADIIRTVAIAPTFRSVGVLAIIVLIRTFLSFALEVELEGRWPWQRRGEPGDQEDQRT